jgi:hypothetical protein
MYPHVIRLRGPWHCRAAPDGTPRRVVMPCGWADVVAGERVCFTRRFGYPGRIDDFERVWIVGEGVSGHATLRLNGEALGRSSPGGFEFDATRRLQARNELEIELTRDPGAKAPWSDVALEVRCTAYLRNVRFENGAVRGEVRGTWSTPLEIYVLCDGAQAGYHVVPPAPDGVAFVLPVADASGYRVDLVNVSSIWHRVEIVVAKPCSEA